MSGSSRNALYVLRLVLQGQATPFATSTAARTVTTAAAQLDRNIEVSSPSTSPSTVRARSHAHRDGGTDLSSQGLSTPSFLESESSEYKSVTLTLPATSYHPEPIQWPTLFPHPSSAHTASRRRQNMCNPLYRLVAEEKYTDGLRVLDELRHHHQRIQHRHIYLGPMVEALYSGDRQSALKWFDIYPNRPATSTHPELKKIWEPVINLLKSGRKGVLDDQEFLDAFMILAGKKGLLPTLLPPVLPHLAFSVPAHRSQPLLDRCITAYVQSTTSDQSITSRAEVQKEIVRTQVSHWWASYLRKLIIGGWKEEAKALYLRRPMDVEWDHITEKIVKEELEESATDAVSSENGTASDSLSITDTAMLAQRIRSSLRDIPKPNDLAALIRALSHPLITHDHPSLLSRFNRRFTHPPSLHRARTTPTVQSRLWLHAEILNLQREGHHQEAIKLFQDNLIWIGLPNHPLLVEADMPTLIAGIASNKKMYPNIQIITTLFPSMILTLPPSLKKTIPRFFDSYISAVPSFPPSLRPTSATFSVLLRELTHHCGSLAGLRALRSISSTGLYPGEEGYAGVLLALAGKRNTTYMWSLLNQAEREDMIGRRTYRGLVAVLVKTGLGKDAEKMFWRARERLDREDVFDGLDLE